MITIAQLFLRNRQAKKKIIMLTMCTLHINNTHLNPQSSKLHPLYSSSHLCLYLDDGEHSLLSPLTYQVTTAISLQVDHKTTLCVELSCQNPRPAQSLQTHVTLSHLKFYIQKFLLLYFNLKLQLLFLISYIQRIIGWCRGWKSLSGKAEEFIM